MKKKVLLLTLAFSSLFIGISIYFVLDTNIILLGSNNSKMNKPNWEFVRNYFSDFFYMVFICSISHFYFSIKISKIYIFIILLSPIIHELLQVQHILPGTFDVFDLVLYFSVILTYYLCFFRFYEH
jgi:hypothetical protein